MTTNFAPTGAAHRRGVFRPGDRVQLTDAKGRPTTITLKPNQAFHTHRGAIAHDDLIGSPEGVVVRTTGGVEYLALRPLLSDHVLSMPRGAAVVYPKDAAQIVAMADIYPGARVVEAGVGSGALTMSLLRAVGDGGHLVSVERRPEFAHIAQTNVESFFGGAHPAWTLQLGSVADHLQQVEAGSVDRVVLDMLAPWENLEAAAQALAPGGVFLAYVATTTQLSRVAETIRAVPGFTEPVAWESLVRSWHLEGLAVRPDHRMVGHTGFLITTRRLAPGVTAPLRKRRPAKGVVVGDDWAPEDLGEITVSERKLRRLQRAAAVGTDENTAPQRDEPGSNSAEQSFDSVGHTQDDTAMDFGPLTDDGLSQ